MATTTSSSELDARGLAAELARELAGEVRFSHGSRALYANDASIYRQLPIGVVVPRTTEDVEAAVDVCRRHGAPIFGRGCGTGLAGQSVNAAVLIDFSKYLHRILDVSPGERAARVQPGVILDHLRDAAEEHDLTFGPDPATHSRCTLGGMIGNNSCGVHSILAGVTADNIEELDVLLYDGTRLRVGKTDDDELERILAGGGRRAEIYASLRALRDRYADLIRERYPRIPRRISGYNLDRLLPEHGFDVAAALVGSESTCALTLEARCTLIESPQHRSLVLLGYDAPWTAADQVAEIMAFEPVGLETFDRRLVDNELRKGFKRDTGLLPDGDAWLLVEFGADTKDEADERAVTLVRAIGGGGDHVDLRRYEDAGEIQRVWEIREGGVGHSKVPGEHPGWPSFEDAAVAPEDTGRFLHDFEALVTDHGLRVSAYFGHVGHGCVHTRLDWDFSTPAGVRRYRRFMEDASDLVASYHGSLSGEHGDGHARAEFLDRIFGPELLDAFREFKAIWDPDGRMNPGKVVDPYPTEAHLRTGPDYRPRPLETAFRWPDDGGSFAAAAERCFGVGACRETEGGVMCPSFMVTREELHSTRGRARLLFELVRGELADGWRDETVKEALDLCLACKGCKRECPVRVDVASYKAEFLHHHYTGRLRPRQAYALGFVFWWARLASLAPRLANAAAHAPIVAAAAKRLAGVAPERDLPAFAPETLHRWFRRRGGPRGAGAPVVLWVDTFTNHFQPHVGRAAVEVLEDAGRRVHLPPRGLCCGRPLYDYGMLDLARRKLHAILDGLQPAIRDGIPIVGLEPSCVAVFRDELVNLLPDDPDAQRLADRTYTLGEYLAGIAAEYRPPRLRRRALVHFHCHQTATTDIDCDRHVLDALGLDYDVLDSGCCGMAGSFGYEAGHRHDVSIAAGERVLLPAARQASADTLLVTDGFSCREQIAQATGRRAHHLAEVLALAAR